MRRIIEISTNSEDLVVDLHTGSEATADTEIQTSQRFFIVESGNHAHTVPKIREYER